MTPNPAAAAIRLGVNVDHIATLRQARGTAYPSPMAAALVAQGSGADSITAHLREDRRHIQEADIFDLRSNLGVPLNLELSLDEAVVRIAERVKPQACCLVPEKREEVTTEGGLDVVARLDRVREVVGRLSAVGSRVSLFVEAEDSQLVAAVATGAQAVEIHTGHYAQLADPAARSEQLTSFARFAEQAHAAGLQVHAGHGLHIDNLAPVAAIPQIEELNIGHALIADAVFMGMAAAVARMKGLMLQVRSGRGFERER